MIDDEGRRRLLEGARLMTDDYLRIGPPIAMDQRDELVRKGKHEAAELIHEVAVAMATARDERRQLWLAAGVPGIETADITDLLDDEDEPGEA